MMKRNKNYLDERQEQKLLQLESKSFWLTYWLLLIVLIVQTVVDLTDIIQINIPPYAGEWVVFMIACVYLFAGCMKNNIWSRGLKPNFKTNLIVSLIAGAVTGLVFAVVSHIRYHAIYGSIAVFIFMTAFTGALCLLALSLSSAAHIKKSKLDEAQADEAEE